MTFAEQLQTGHTDEAQMLPRDAEYSLPHQIAAIIRSRIIHDEIKPGTPIRERKLADELEVSRTPLRDALKILAQEKLVDLIPNKGAVVVEYSLDDIADMLLVYTELDLLGGRLACRMANESDFLQVERQMERMDAAINAHDRIEYFRANQAFHMAIIAASRSKTTVELHSKLSLRLHRVRYLSILENDEWMARSDDHVNLLQALRDRDAERFTAIQRDHFGVAWRLIDSWINRNQTAQT